MDIVDSATRSRMMGGIRSKNTGPEMIVRRFLHARGFRYRLHEPRLLGRPDIVLPKYHVAIFVHGCFWHQHFNCRYATTPASNCENWKAKFLANEERDQRNIRALENSGWYVVIIWECGLRTKDDGTRLTWLIDAINQPKGTFMQWPHIGKTQGTLE